MAEQVRLRLSGADQVVLIVAPTKKALQRLTRSEDTNLARAARRMLKRFDRLGVRVSDVARAFERKRATQWRKRITDE